MPELDEIMNVFANGPKPGSSEGGGADDGRMPSVNTIIGPEVKWVNHGRYHHAKDTNPFTGFKWDYAGAEMNRWWSMRKPGTRLVAGPGGHTYEMPHDWDYAGYTMISGLWGDPDPDKGGDAEDVQTPFRSALDRLSKVIPDSMNGNSSALNASFDWSPTKELIGNLVNLEEMFTEFGEGSDSDGYLLTAYKNLDIPEGPMTGSAAAVFGAKIYHLYLRFQEMQEQVHNNHQAIKDLGEDIRKKGDKLRSSVESVMDDESSKMRPILDQWYHRESNGRQRWNHETGQFWIRISEGEYGPVSNPATDENVNNRLKEMWKKKFEHVIADATSLYNTMDDLYEAAHKDLKIIQAPEGGFPLNIDSIGDEEIPGGGGDDIPDFPDEIKLTFDDEGLGGGDDGPGGGDGGPDVPDWMKEPPPGYGGPDINYETDGGPDLGLGGPDGDGPGSGNDVPGPPTYLEGGPGMPLNGPGGLGPGGLGPGGLGPGGLGPGGLGPGSLGPGGDGPGHAGFLPGAPPLGMNGPGGPGSFGGGGDPSLIDGPGHAGFLPGAPPLGMNGPGGPGGGRRDTPGLGTDFPPPTALEVDPETGLPINPDTGRPFPVDPETGIPFDPGTGLPINYDPATGAALPIDPTTGMPIQDGGTRLDMDPETGLPINPDTGLPFPVDPETGIPFDPDTGLPINYDPVTGQVAPIDPTTGMPVAPDPVSLPSTDPGLGTNFPPGAEGVYENPITGEPAEINPETGLPYPIDPLTGEAITERRPDPEPLNYPSGPSNSSMPFQSGGPPMDLNYGGVNTPPPTSSYDPGGGSGGLDSSDRSSMFAAPGGGGALGGVGGPGGGVGGPGGEGAAPGQPGMGGHGAPGMPPPMMPPMGGGMGGGGGGDNGRERNRATWLTEDEKVWGTDKTRGKSVLGRPVPGEKKGASRHEFIDAGADGSRTGTSSNDDEGTRGRKRKPGIGNRRGNSQKQAGDGDGRRDRTSD